ncbi:MAG: glycosyl hydrolase family 18 protein [Myxococcota bacterium]
MLLLSLSAYAMPVPVVSEPTGPHAQQVAQYGGALRPATVPSRGPLPIPTPGPDIRVYGYQAYWSDDLSTVPWDDLTDIAIFSAGVNSDGTLYDTSKWDIADDAVAIAAPYGVHVHLCVTNFSPSSLEALLSSATSRNELIDELVTWKADTGAHGVNIDFEGLPYAVKSEMVTFTRDLEAAVGEVVLAGPSVDWAGSWDYDQLTQYADIFIMGYGYHWGGSDYAGPSDPLYAGSGTVWSGVQSYSLSWTIDDYLTYGADPSRIILGLPLYGMSWPTSNNSVPTGTNGTGSSVVFSDAWADEASYGRNWEGDSLTPYTYGGGDQIWYGDEESVRERIVYTRDVAQVSGFGFWALHYDGDDASFWNMIRSETTFTPTGTTTTTGPGTTTDTTSTPTGSTSGTTTGTTSDPTNTGDPPVGTSGFHADAGAPFLAYLGDTVVLSGTGSTGPSGVELVYRWTQIAGPEVTLSDATEAEPAFTVDRAGTHVFELLVGDGTRWSPPARSYLVVIDPGLPERHAGGCGCSGGAGSAGFGLGGLLVLGAVALRRRSADRRL